MSTKKYLMKLFAKIFLCSSSCFLTIQNSAAATECLSDYEPANITQLAPNLFGISPPYASFDPCNKSVVLNIVKNSTKLVIVMHGGGGGADSQAKLASALNKEGISTLFFDAFKMNKLYKDARWWALNNTTGPKQRMLYHSNLAAVKWLKKILKQRNWTFTFTEFHPVQQLLLIFQAMKIYQI